MFLQILIIVRWCKHLKAWYKIYNNKWTHTKIISTSFSWSKQRKLNSFLMTASEKKVKQTRVLILATAWMSIVTTASDSQEAVFVYSSKCQKINRGFKWCTEANNSCEIIPSIAPIRWDSGQWTGAVFNPLYSGPSG